MRGDVPQFENVLSHWLDNDKLETYAAAFFHVLCNFYQGMCVHGSGFFVLGVRTCFEDANLRLTAEKEEEWAHRDVAREVS